MEKQNLLALKQSLLASLANVEAALGETPHQFFTFQITYSANVRVLAESRADAYDMVFESVDFTIDGAEEGEMLSLSAKNVEDNQEYDWTDEIALIEKKSA